MPKQTGKSGLASKLAKVRKDIRYKAPEPPKGGGTLPAGVRGIAKLTRLDFDVIEDGDYSGEQRLYCHGVCVSPKTFKDSEGNEHVTEGALVQLNRIMLCDTKYQDKVTPFAENWAKAENRMKLLGIPTEDLDDDEFEKEVLDYVKTTDIFFKFRTWKPNDSDRINVVLEGTAKDFEQQLEDDVDDSTEDTPEEAPKPKKTRTSKKAQPEPEVQEEPEVEEVEEEAETEEPEVEEELATEKLNAKELVALGKKADKGDKASQIAITQMADAAGVDTEPYETWSEVVEALIEEEPAAEMTPEPGDIFKYGKSEVEVVSVNAKAKTADCKDLVTKKTHKAVAWAKLVALD
jgi:hypothetical protein